MAELHYTKYLRAPVLDIRYSFLYFAAVIVSVQVVCLIGVRRTDFLDEQE